jgi:hypothetical protein
MSGDATARRIGLFCVGGALAASCAFVAWIAFALATMMMDPTLRGAEYRAAVVERLQSSPQLVALVAAGVVGAAVGIAVMVRALFGRLKVTA